MKFFSLTRYMTDSQLIGFLTSKVGKDPTNLIKQYVDAERLREHKVLFYNVCAQIRVKFNHLFYSLKPGHTVINLKSKTEAEYNLIGHEIVIIKRRLGEGNVEFETLPNLSVSYRYKKRGFWAKLKATIKNYIGW